MKLTIGEAREFVRARLDELAAQGSDMLLGSTDDRNLDNTIDKLLEDAVTFIHLAAPASLMEGPMLTESNFPAGALDITNKVLDIDTALSDIDDDILRLISFQCGDSDIKLTSSHYEDSPQARMQLNPYLQGRPDEPALVKLDDSPDYKPHYKYYTTDMCLDNLGEALHFVLRYFARPKLKSDPESVMSVSPSSLIFQAGAESKTLTVTVASEVSWEIVSNIPSWLTLSASSGTGPGTITISTLHHYGSDLHASLTFSNGVATAVLEVTKRGRATGGDDLRVTGTSLSNNVLRLPSRSVEDVQYLTVAATEGLAWTAILSDTENFYAAPLSGVGTGIENYIPVAVRALNVNDTGSARVATLIFTANGVTPITITLRQPSELTVTPRLTSVGSAAGTCQFVITTESAWTASFLADPDSHPEGFSLSSYSGTGSATITCSYPANAGDAVRLMGFTVSGGGATVQVVISQGAPSQDFISISPSTLGPFPTSGDTSGVTGSATVTASGPWTLATLEASWLAVRTTANGLIVSSMDANSGEARTAVARVYLTGNPSVFAELAITQEGVVQAGITLLDTNDNDNATVSPSAQTLTLRVGNTNGGAWEIPNSTSFATVSPTSGRGDSNVTVTIPANTDVQRQGVITARLVGQLTGAHFYLIQQAGQAPVALTLLDANGNSSKTVPASAGTLTLTVTIASGAAWTVSEGESWVSLSPVGATGPGNVTVTISANSGAARDCAITAQNTATGETATFYLHQEAPQVTNYYIDLTRNENMMYNDEEVGAAGDSWLPFDVRSNGHWTLATSDSWLTPVTSSGAWSGSGNATRYVAVAANTGAARTGRIVGTLQETGETSTFYIYQEGGAANTLDAYFDKSTVDAEGETIYLTVRASNNLAWSLTNISSGLTPASSSGTGPATIAVAVAATSAARTLSLTVRNTRYNLSATASVNQEAPVQENTLRVTPFGTILTPYYQTAQDFSIESSTSWQVRNSDPDVTIYPTSGNGNGIVVAEFPENEGTSTRDITLIFETTSGSPQITRTVTIRRDRAPAYLRVLPFGTVAVPNTSTVQQFTVESSESWAVTNDDADVTVSPASGSGDGVVTVSFPANTGDEPRSIELSFDTTGTVELTVEATIVQAAAPEAEITVSPTTVRISGEGGGSNVLVTANRAWTVEKTASWITVSRASGNAGTEISVVIGAGRNTTGAQRTGTVTFRCDSYHFMQVGVIQDKMNTLLLSANEVELGAAIASRADVTVFASGRWAVENREAWLSAAPQSHEGNLQGETLVLRAAGANTSVNPRSVTIPVYLTDAPATGQWLTVTQRGATTIEVSPETLAMPNTPASDTLTVNAGGNWTVRSDKPWLTVSPASGSAGDGQTVTVTTTSQNTTISPRTATLTFTCGNVTKTVTVTQSQTDQIYFNKSGGVILGNEDDKEASGNIIASGEWEVISSLPSWLTVEPESTHAGSGYPGEELVFTALTDTTADRSTTVRVALTSDNDIYIDIPVKQEAPHVEIPEVGRYGITGEGWTGQIHVKANCSWHIELDTNEGTASGITASPLTGTGDATISYEVSDTTSSTWLFHHIKVYSSDDTASDTYTAGIVKISNT